MASSDTHTDAGRVAEGLRIADAAEVDYDFDRADRFYTRLRRKVSDWFSRHGGKAGSAVGEILLLLPDLFALVIRLMGDRRLPSSIKLQLAAVSAYVISPIDFMPDFLFPIGFVDDTLALAYVLSRVAKLLDDAGEEILQEHWEGTGSVLVAIRTVTRAANTVLNGRVLGKVRGRFGGDGGKGRHVRV